MAQAECKHLSMTLMDATRESYVKFTCDGCKELGFGPSYLCTTSRCNYQLHHHCKDLPPTKHHPLIKERELVSLQGETLSLSHPSAEEMFKICEACGKEVHGWGYVHHEANDGVSMRRSNLLHPTCVNLPYTMGGRTDSMDFAILREKLELINCDYCRKRDVGERTPGWAYVKASGASACHVKCLNDLAELGVPMLG